MSNLPSNWSGQIASAVSEHRKKGLIPYTLMLPVLWRPELSEFIRDRQINRMFGVARVGFEPDGTKIEVLPPPAEPISSS